ncbi:MAG: KGGVGR-motif variant AAA ATPase [bacterium]
MHVTSFYSYKGGVGRTLCLLNVAWELALRGKRVVLVDLDLEAPGLHRAHLSCGGAKEEKWGPIGKREGLLQAFHAWMDRVDEQNEASQPFDLRLVIDLGPDKNIALLPAGRNDDEQDVDDDYQTLLQRFNWGTFYNKPYCGRNFLEKAVEFLGEQGFEHMLIDARTGLTDVQYVTTIHLPDLVILVTNLTEQSLRGTHEQIQRIDKINKECRRKKGSDHRRLTLEHTPIEMLVVASPVPLGEWAIRSERLDHAERLLDHLDFVVDHLPILACHEDKQILDQRRPRPWSEDPGRTGPAAAFSAIADAVLQRAAASAENLIEGGERMFRAGRWREASAFFDAAWDKETSASRGRYPAASRARVGRAQAQLQGLEPKKVEEDLREEAGSGAQGPARIARLAEAWLAVSWSNVLREDYDKAAMAAHEATALIGDQSNHDLQRLGAFARYVEGDAHAELGKLADASACLAKADEIYGRLPGVYADQAMVLGRFAVILALSGKPDAAEQKLKEAEKQLRRVFVGEIEDRGRRLWAGLREAKAEIQLARGNLTVAADTFSKLQEALGGIDSVGHVHVLSRLYHLHARYGIKRLEHMPNDLPERGLSLRVPQVAMSVRLDQAMQEIKDPEAMKHIDAVRDLLEKTPIRDIELRTDIVQAWGNLARDESVDSTLLERDEHTTTEYYELRYELALIRALTAYKGTETENWRRRTENACQAALGDGLSLWYDLLWIASGGDGSPERPLVADEAAVRNAVRQVLLPLGEEVVWPEPLRNAFTRRYASLAVQEA